ncbi:MAG TPA: hypothetical protein VF322_07055 [Gammaproteobacteria bacterium]
MAAAGLGGAALALLVACTPEQGTNDEPAAGGSGDAAPAATQAAELLPLDREGRAALGLEHATARELYDALRERAGGGERLSPDDMPDWSGLWTRIGPPLYDPAQPEGTLTTAKLKPEARAELEHRRELAAQGIEYDPISDCSPPGFPRWLVIPFLREFIVTPDQTWLFSETTNNMRRIYTDGRDHPPPEDAYPLYYGDSIGFWTDHTLVIHTNQIQENIFHRNDPKHSDQIETVEVWRKTDDSTITADVWAYDPVTLEEPWFTQQTYKQVPNPDKTLRIDYWHCFENPNNTIIQTEEGSSQFSDFTFTDEDDR